MNRIRVHLLMMTKTSYCMHQKSEEKKTPSDVFVFGYTKKKKKIKNWIWMKKEGIIDAFTKSNTKSISYLLNVLVQNFVVDNTEPTKWMRRTMARFMRFNAVAPVNFCIAMSWYFSLVWLMFADSWTFIERVKWKMWLCQYVFHLQTNLFNILFFWWSERCDKIWLGHNNSIQCFLAAEMFCKCLLFCLCFSFVLMVVLFVGK